jgi:hypothetical protein
MFWFLVGVSVFLPLPGFFVLGHQSPFGVAIAYIAHLVVFGVASATVTRSRMRRTTRSTIALPPVGVSRYRAVATIGAMVQLVFLAATVFFFGSIKVLSGSENRGELRSSFGGAGFAFTFVVLYFAPAIWALVAFHYRFLVRALFRDRALLAVNVLFTASTGASLGYKSSMARVLLPGLVALLWRRARLRTFVLLSVVGFAFSVVAGAYFDQRTLAESLHYNQFRATGITARNPSIIWDEHRDGLGAQGYGRTLVSLFGAPGVRALTGAVRGTPEYVPYDFGQLTTVYEFGYDPRALDGRFNTTSTVFGEGVLGFGVPGFLVLSAIAGVLTGAVYRVIVAGIERHRLSQSAALVTFFAIPYLAWINSGGVTAIVHVVTVAGTVSTWFLCRAVENLGVRFADRSDYDWMVPMRELPEGWLTSALGTGVGSTEQHCDQLS